MRPLRFLVPGTSGRFRCGGLLVELQTARMLSSLGSVEVVTYRQREDGRAVAVDEGEVLPVVPFLRICCARSLFQAELTLRFGS